jgi:lipid-A-disaccharide synthase
LIDENSIPNFEGRSFFKLIQILKMKYYIIGEASGDLHGSNLMKAYIKRMLMQIFAFGVDLMQKLAVHQSSIIEN